MEFYRVGQAVSWRRHTTITRPETACLPLQRTQVRNTKKTHLDHTAVSGQNHDSHQFTCLCFLSHRLLHPHESVLFHVHVLRSLLENVQQPVVLRLGPHAVDDRERELPFLLGQRERKETTRSGGTYAEALMPTTRTCVWGGGGLSSNIHGVVVTPLKPSKHPTPSSVLCGKKAGGRSRVARSTPPQPSCSILAAKGIYQAGDIRRITAKGATHLPSSYR